MPVLPCRLMTLSYNSYSQHVLARLLLLPDAGLRDKTRLAITSFCLVGLLLEEQTVMCALYKLETCGTPRSEHHT